MNVSLEITHLPRLGPEPWIFSKDSQPIRRSFGLRVAYSRQRRHTGNAATGPFTLHHRLHGNSSFNFRPPEMLNPSR